METSPHLQKLDANGLAAFLTLQDSAAEHVATRVQAHLTSQGVETNAYNHHDCKEDLRFQLEFLRPVLEFGLLQPMVDYLRWLHSVQEARHLPTAQLALSLDWLGEFFADAMPGTSGEVVAHALRLAQSEFTHAQPDPAAPVLAQTAWPEAQAFESALLSGDQPRALALLNQMMDAGRTLVEVEMHMIQPALYRIGEAWQANQITVAQEHLATAIVQMVMPMGLMRSRPPTLLNKTVLLACVEGNQHAVGLAMVSDAFALAGWQVQHLGANVPTQSLLAQIEATRPDLVGLSVSFPQQLHVAKQVIDLLKSSMGPARPAVMVGGLAVNRFDQLSTVLGADASGVNATAALALAQRMVQAHQG